MRLRMKNGKAFEKKETVLLDFARSYLSEGFPNPDREGCPPDDALRSLAFSPRECEPEVTEHLAACSPCFRRYSELLAELNAQQQAAESRWSRISVWSKTHPVLAGTTLACALLVAICVGFLLRGNRQPNPPPIETKGKPGPTEPLNPNVAYTPFSLDLSRLSFPVRGSESAPTGTKQRVLVPNSPLNLTLTLPFASPEGRYEVKLAAGGQTFWSKPAQAHLQKGKTLIQVEADLTKIQAGNYNLEVRSLTGIRLIQPVSIQPPLPNRGERKP
jgi:hypothetical protein